MAVRAWPIMSGATLPDAAISSKTERSTPLRCVTQSEFALCAPRAAIATCNLIHSANIIVTFLPGFRKCSLCSDRDLRVCLQLRCCPGKCSHTPRQLSSGLLDEISFLSWATCANMLTKSIGFSRNSANSATMQNKFVHKHTRSVLFFVI